MAYWLSRTSGWFYSAVNVLRPRNLVDRVLLSASGVTATDDGVSPLQIDVGTAAAQAAKLRGFAYLNGALIFEELGANLTCSATTLQTSAGTASTMGLYMKGDKFVLAYLCGASGVVKFATLQLDGMTCTFATGVTP